MVQIHSPRPLSFGQATQQLTESEKVNERLAQDPGALYSRFIPSVQRDRIAHSSDHHIIHWNEGMNIVRKIRSRRGSVASQCDSTKFPI